MIVKEELNVFKKYRIGIASILSFLIFIGVLYSFSIYVNKKLESQLMTSLKDISDQNVKLIQNEINNNLILLSNLAEQFSDYTEEEFSKSSSETNILSNRFNFREMGIALKNGIAYMSSNKIYDVSQREYFKASINGQNHVSEVLKYMGDDSDINIYSVPIINSSEEVSGVLFAMYDTEEFSKLLQVDSFNGSGYSYIINSEGDILNISQEEFTGERNLFDRLRNDSITFKYKSVNHKSIREIQRAINDNKLEGNLKYWRDTYKYAVYKKLEINDWFLVTVVPREIITERIVPITRAINFICLFIFVSAIFVIIYCINKDKKLKLYLKNVAYKDTFTGLYNKNYLKDKITTKYINKQGYKSALILFNIKGFKLINEIYGVKAGDYLIKTLAGILEESLFNKGDIVARSNADEFLALYFYEDNNKLENKINEIARRIKKVSYNGNNIFVKLYIGIYEINELEDDFEKIYNYANIAKNKVKDSNFTLFKYYNDELAEKEIRQRQLEDEIKEAIINKEFKSYFQPKYDCKTREIVGCEALARWYRSDGEIYYPSDFIEISEKNGLIKEIDKLIIEDACININKWRKKELKVPPISINISRIYLNNMDIICDLNTILTKYDIPTKYIQLEITESSLVSNEEMLNKIINEMHKYGFKVLLDDFGVGYSSLHSINKLNFDTLKIDKSFVKDIGSNNGNCVIKHTIDLGRNLGMEVVVEGVETELQYEFLRQSGCNTIQGYYFSRPLDNENFEKLLKDII